MRNEARAEFLKSSFDQGYPVSVEALGARSSDTDARQVVRRAGLPLSELGQVRRAFLEADSFVYEGVQEWLGGNLAHGDAIRIWTQGETKGFPDQDVPGFDVQHRKVVKSGLRPALLGRGLSRDEKRRFSVTAVEMNKTDVLPGVIGEMVEMGYQDIVVVDDKASNVWKAHQVVEEVRQRGEIGENVRVHIVWMNQGRSKDKLPKGFEGSLDEFKSMFATMESIPELQEWGNQLRESLPFRRVAWVLDWDHTLGDETKRKNSIREALVGRYEDDERVGSVRYLSEGREFEAVVNFLGIPASRALMQEFKGGASGVGVYHVNWDGSDCVVKCERNLDRQWRIAEEIKGYDLVARDSLLGALIPRVHRVETDNSELGHVLVMDYLNGPDLRRAVVEGLLPDDVVVGVAHQVMDMQEGFYMGKRLGNGVIRNSDKWFSMQQQEWPETQVLLTQVVEQLAQRLGIDPGEIWEGEIVVNNNGCEMHLPALKDVVAMADLAVNARPGAILDWAFNDMSWGNVIAQRVNGGYKPGLVDPQWARENSDPAGDLVRTIKAVSSTTARFDDDRCNVYVDNGRLVFTVGAEVHRVLIEAEQRAYSRVPAFAGILGDESFPQRVAGHMVASHLREMALVAKGRGKIERLGFNLAQIAHYMNGNVR